MRTALSWVYKWCFICFVSRTQRSLFNSAFNRPLYSSTRPLFYDMQNDYQPGTRSQRCKDRLERLETLEMRRLRQALISLHVCRLFGLVSDSCNEFVKTSNSSISARGHAHNYFNATVVSTLVKISSHNVTQTILSPSVPETVSIRENKSQKYRRGWDVNRWPLALQPSALSTRPAWIYN